MSLSANGNVLAISAHYNDGVNGQDSGQVRVFQRDGSNWNQVGSDIDGKVAGDQFGSSVSLSADGTVLAVGAPGNDENGSDSGNVRVFSF